MQGDFFCNVILRGVFDKIFRKQYDIISIHAKNPLNNIFGKNYTIPSNQLHKIIVFGKILSIIPKNMYWNMEAFL